MRHLTLTDDYEVDFSPEDRNLQMVTVTQHNEQAQAVENLMG